MAIGTEQKKAHFAYCRETIILRQKNEMLTNLLEKRTVAGVFPQVVDQPSTIRVSN